MEMPIHECNQGERFAILETKYGSMAEKIDRIEDKVDTLSDKFDALLEKMENKFVLRTEFKVGLGVVGAIATVIGLVAYFVK